MIVSLIGMPCSGKTTIGRRMAARLNWGFFSSGEWARLRGLDSSEASIYEQDLSLKLNDEINAKVKLLVKRGSNWILDGYPRSLEQANLLSTYNQEIKLYFVTVDFETAIKRMEGRNREGEGLELVVRRRRSSLYLFGELTRAGFDISLFKSVNVDSDVERMVSGVQKIDR
jgi:adenylate kinase family enzyme